MNNNDKYKCMCGSKLTSFSEVSHNYHVCVDEKCRKVYSELHGEYVYTGNNALKYYASTKKPVVKQTARRK